MPKRRVGLKVFLSEADVPMDTNHLERALRVIPMGRRAWLFCWTKRRAEQLGIVHLRAPANIINLSTFIPSWINVSKAA